VVPITLIIDGKSYRDQVDITSDEFFKVLKEVKELPTTSAVSPGQFEEAFRELGKSSSDVVCIVLSKDLSATYDSAILARDTIMKDMPDMNIEIVDSRSTGGGLGFVVLEAARAAQSGKSSSEVIDVANNIIQNVKWIGALDTLRYLVKGGRAPKAAGLVGELLHIKPILGMFKHTGEVDMGGKERTTKKAIAGLLKMVKSEMDTSKPAHIIVHYSDDIKAGEHLKELVIAEFNCAEIYLSEFTPVMCCHTGPLVAIAFHSS
ncbi:MAG: DegV family protein, partial [Chloroflexota bacterium]|nr:DegV family protein [Chloroflexota bacterium]